MNRTIMTAAALLAVAPAALAQTNVAPAHKFAWQENTGWMNWRDAGNPAGAHGVRVNATFLQGFAWGGNIGYINFGDGTPGGGTAYTNATGADHGVNILAGGDLAGYAWGENVGWINFHTAPFVPPAQRARFDAADRRFRGYAWGENIGWINLDDADQFVGVFQCGCDWNADNVLNSQDFFDFLTDFFGVGADYNVDGLTNSQDFFDFLTCFFSGCP